jgi:peptide/nickel transport system substrate-binding protein
LKIATRTLGTFPIPITDSLTRLFEPRHQRILQEAFLDDSDQERLQKGDAQEMCNKASRLWRLLLVIAVVSMLVGVAQVPSQAAEPAKKVLVVAAANQYGETLDPFTTATTMFPHNMIYDGLVTVDSKLQYQPGLAEKWEVSPDGLTWTFYLRKGVKFHDGSPFNASVVKWWLEGMKKGVNAYMFESMTEAKVVDDSTIQMIFPAPFPNLLYNLSNSFSGITSQAAYEKYGKDYGTKYAVGTGPFMLKEWVPNDHLLLVKNPDYDWSPEWTGHKGPANVDEVLYRIIPEDATRVVELQSGNVQLMVDPPPARELAQFQDNPDYQVVTVPSMSIQFIGMNLAEPLLKDLRTRQAIGYAIDRQLINETVYQGMGTPTTTYLCQELGGNQGVASVAPSFDLEKAKALLAEAGWKPGPDGVLVADKVEGVAPGTRFVVSYWTYQEDEYRRLAEVTQKMLADIGIKTTVQLMDNPTYADMLKSGKSQIILRQYQWDNNDILEWFLHGKQMPYPNYLAINDQKLNDMLDQANYKTPTVEERDKLYVELHKYLIQTLYPWAPIRQGANVILARSNVKNLMALPLRGLSSTQVWAALDLQ